MNKLKYRKLEKVRKSPFSNFRRFWWKCDRTVVSYHKIQKTEKHFNSQHTFTCSTKYCIRLKWTTINNNYKQLFARKHCQLPNKQNVKQTVNRLARVANVSSKVARAFYKTRQNLQITNYVSRDLTIQIGNFKLRLGNLKHSMNCGANSCWLNDDWSLL